MRKLYKYKVSCNSPYSNYVVASSFVEASKVAEQDAARLRISRYVLSVELIADDSHLTVCEEV